MNRHIAIVALLLMLEYNNNEKRQTYTSRNLGQDMSKVEYIVNPNKAPSDIQ